MSADAERLIAYWEAGKTHDSYTTLALKGDDLAAALAAATAENERLRKALREMLYHFAGDFEPSESEYYGAVEDARAALASRVPQPDPKEKE